MLLSSDPAAFEAARARVVLDGGGAESTVAPLALPRDGFAATGTAASSPALPLLRGEFEWPSGLRSPPPPPSSSGTGVSSACKRLLPRTPPGAAKPAFSDMAPAIISLVGEGTTLSPSATCDITWLRRCKALDPSRLTARPLAAVVSLLVTEEVDDSIEPVVWFSFRFWRTLFMAASSTSPSLDDPAVNDSTEPYMSTWTDEATTESSEEVSPRARAPY
jgi:hypothetical protein